MQTAHPSSKQMENILSYQTLTFVTNILSYQTLTLVNFLFRRWANQLFKYFKAIFKYRKFTNIWYIYCNSIFSKKKIICKKEEEYTSSVGHKKSV
jgi:hypothetical protein